MFRVATALASASLIGGLIVGCLLPLIWQRQAKTELLNRPGNNLYCIYGSFVPYPQEWDTSSKLLREAGYLMQKCVDASIDTLPVPPAFKRMDNFHLYIQSGLAQKYEADRVLVAHHLGQREYRQAACVAFDAMQIRSCGWYHASSEEESFADHLVCLGLYGPAKEVIQSLPAVSETPDERNNPGPFLAERQQLLGQAYLGLHDYQSAIRESQRPIANLTESDSNRGALKYVLNHACLASGDNQTAYRLLAELDRNPNADNILVRSYIAISRLRKEDHSAAGHIAQDLLAYWKALDNAGQNCFAPDGIPELEFAAECMRVRGQATAASELQVRADQLKYQNRNARQQSLCCQK